MKIGNRHINAVFLMPKIDNAYLNRAKKAELKVLYYLFAHGGMADLAAMKCDLEETESTLTSALAFWRAAGVIEEAEEPEETEKPEKPEETEKEDVSGQTASPEPVVRRVSPVPSYSLTEIASARERDSEYASLLAYLEKLTGKVFNAAEQGIVLYLYDTAGIAYEVIMGVAQYCVSKGKSSLRYIEKTTLNLHDEGINTYAELEAHLMGEQSHTRYEDMVKRVIGAMGRALTRTEKQHVRRFETEFKASEELVSLAYDKTVAKIGKAQLSYMAKILESWHEKGLDTPEKVEKALQSGKDFPDAKKADGRKTDGGRLHFDLEDIFEKPV